MGRKTFCPETRKNTLTTTSKRRRAMVPSAGSLAPSLRPLNVPHPRSLRGLRRPSRAAQPHKHPAGRQAPGAFSTPEAAAAGARSTSCCRRRRHRAYGPGDPDVIPKLCAGAVASAGPEGRRDDVRTRSDARAGHRSALRAHEDSREPGDSVTTNTTPVSLPKPRCSSPALHPGERVSTLSETPDSTLCPGSLPGM